MPGTRQAFKILYHCKYVDDLLILADSGPATTMTFIKWLRHRVTAISELEFVEASSTSIAIGNKSSKCNL